MRQQDAYNACYAGVNFYLERILLYTLLIDYKGGTYISQGFGNSVIEGFKSAINSQNFSEIPDFKTVNKDTFISEVEENGFNTIEGTKNVFCTSFSIEGYLAISNLIATIET